MEIGSGKGVSRSTVRYRCLGVEFWGICLKHWILFGYQFQLNISSFHIKTSSKWVTISLVTSDDSSCLRLRNLQRWSLSFTVEGQTLRPPPRPRPQEVNRDDHASPPSAMSTTSIPRFLLPREASYQLARSLHPSALRQSSSFTILPRIRHASNSSKSASSSKPLVLEKPSKFNPPSHPARLNRAPPRQYPGPPLSAPEKEAQKSRKYPRMMPAEGTFMHWFLTNRSIHLSITLVRNRILIFT